MIEFSLAANTTHSNLGRNFHQRNQ